jgi:hypothetical protein
MIRGTADGEDGGTCRHSAASYVFGNGIQRTQRAHFVRTHFAAIDHHPVMKADDGLAAGARVSPWKYCMKKTGHGAAQHGPAKTQRVATVLKIRLAYRCGVIGERPPNGSKCHVGTPGCGYQAGRYRIQSTSSRTTAADVSAGTQTTMEEP